MAASRPRGRYVNPVPGGTVGRTDQGVDISARPGSRVLAITREKLVGIINNWYLGQPYYWFEQLDSRGRPTGVFNYMAEQVRSTLRIGQTVQAGQQVGIVADSGTGMEFGFSTASGETQARATSGYTEGQATPSGRAYRSQVILGGRATATAPGPSSYLANLWIQAGGSPSLANTMAAIAMAESSGRANAVNHNTNGSTDYGLWQINSVHGYNSARLLSDPLYNAKAAVAIEKSQGLGAWTTYTSGAYKAFLSGGTAVAPSYGGSRPNTSGSGCGSKPDSKSPTLLQDYVNVRDTQRVAPPGTKNPFKWWQASFTGNWDQLKGDTEQ